ncbi:hypothetical protein N7444_000119 [Penicillium canescens]|nr:hypothetical protein N7444_000119 [Penicillium canescens]
MYNTSTSSQTGISTPRFSQSLRPLILSHGPLEFAYLVSTSLHFHASQLTDYFTASIPAPTAELAQDGEPSSVTELVALYIGQVAREVEEGEDDAQGSYLEVLKLALNEFECAVMRGNDIHAVAAVLSGIVSKKTQVVKFYYAGRAITGRPTKPYDSALFSAASTEEAGIYTVFGGQGNIEEYFDELRAIYTTYPSFISELILPSEELLHSLSREPEAKKLYPKGLDIMPWLKDRDAQPDTDYLVSAPVSLPFINLVQLAHYMVICNVLGRQQGELLERIKGTTGHSQGVITAAAIATATSWETFAEASRNALIMLFWIGLRSQQAYPHTSIAPSMLQDSIENGEGTPTPMLSIWDLPQAAVQEHIDVTNQHLPGIAISRSPYQQCAQLCGYWPSYLPTRVPFMRRKIRFINRFLPITALFHSQYITSAYDRIIKDLEDTNIPAESLAIPVYHTHSNPYDYSRCRQLGASHRFPGATHIIDLGPGGISGLGVLTSHNKDGTSVRVIVAGEMDGTNVEVGYRPELFDRRDHLVKYASKWVNEYDESPVRHSPVMVAGMTPTTVAWNFVAATMNAGYHIELGGGGFYDAKTMPEAITKIEKAIPPGRDGLTIGAGVPSIEVANEYIETLGIKRIAFKPGSVDAIQQMINIAKTNPKFLIIMQWTGGRGDGHHSFEDFHRQTLQMYGRVHAPGVDDMEWENTYKDAAEVESLPSSLRWKIFKLDKAKHVPELKKQRDYIIKKLNDDFQKVWFGRNTAGETVNLEGMTYAEIIHGMVDLIVSLVTSLRRVEERFTTNNDQHSKLQSYSELDTPYPAVNDVLTAYPEAATQLINAQDVQYFLLLCQRRGQKPARLVPSLDEIFEYFLKKDSLSQSEDLEAVGDQDVGRTYILDDVHQGHINGLLRDIGQLVNTDDQQELEGLTVSEDTNKISFHLSTSSSVGPRETDRWLRLLAGDSYSWRHALFLADVFVQGHRFQTNPLKQISFISVREPYQSGKLVKTVEAKMKENGQISLTLFEGRTADRSVVPLSFLFTYHPETGYAPVREAMEGRNDRIKEFYYRIWFSSKDVPFDTPTTATFQGGQETITSQAVADFVHAVGNTGEAFVNRPGKEVFAPIDFAIVVGWKAITKSIFPRTIDGDLLRLINAVINQHSGKMVEVCGTIKRNGMAIMHITSQFLYRGNYEDFGNTFQRGDEGPMQVNLATGRDVAVLRSKEWFCIEEPDIEFLGLTITFHRW